MSPENISVVQMGLGGDFGHDLVDINQIGILPRLKPAVANFQPVMVIGATGKERLGQLSNIPQPGIGKVIYAPSLETLLRNSGKIKNLPHGVVIFASPEDPAVRIISDKFFTKGKDRHLRRLWLVEGNVLCRPGEVELQQRKDRLRRLGLVELKVDYDSQTGTLIFTGRPEKKTKRKPSNLFERPWISRLMVGVDRELNNLGFRVVDREEISKILRESRSPRNDISRLRMGFGMIVRGPCGDCLYSIDKRGVVTQILDCVEGADCWSILDSLESK